MQDKDTPYGLCQCGCGQPTTIARYSNTARGWIAGEPKRWVQGHGSHPKPLAERFWAKVEKTDTCWLWTAGKALNGYGQFKMGKQKHVLAHRVAYELCIGPIPAGLQIDHLCRVRHCVNPSHMEPVTPAENTRRGLGLAAINSRKTHCQKGHAFTSDNTRYTPEGTRVCRICRREWSLAYRLRREAEAANV